MLAGPLLDVGGSWDATGPRNLARVEAPAASMAVERRVVGTALALNSPDLRVFLRAGKRGCVVCDGPRLLQRWSVRLLGGSLQRRVSGRGGADHILWIRSLVESLFGSVS